MRKNATKTVLAGISVLAAWGEWARADVVTITTSTDATLLGGTDATSNNSLSDPGVFVGTDGQDNPKRGLVRFDIADNVPSGATITSVTLQLTVGQVAGSGGGSGGGGGSPTISLYDEPQAWGVPTNFAGATSFGGHGHGFAPATGDATWNYAFYNTTTWSTGTAGDYTNSSVTLATDSSISATTSGQVSWSSPSMVTEVQSWVNTPTSNNGFLLVNADETTATDFLAFWGEQGAINAGTTAWEPSLTVSFSAPEPVGVSMLGVGTAIALLRRRRRVAL